MYYQLRDRNELYYEVTGPEHASVTLVFLNGLSQSTLAWSAIVPSLSATMRVVVLDLVFQGKSSSASTYRTFDEHAKDVAELIVGLNLTRVVLCGISYGSAVAQHILVQNHDVCIGAVLLSTFAHETPLFTAIGESWKSALLQGGYALMLEVMLPTVLGRTYFEKPLIPIQTLKELRVSANLETTHLLALMRATEERGDYRSQLRSISCPVLVMQGEEDFLIPPNVAREVADHIPGAQFKVVEKAGHTLNLEAIPQTLAAIREFVKQFE
jgi:3-oxoadipate enol-lactonase